MKRAPTSTAPSPLPEEGDVEFEAKKQEILEDLEAGTIELRPFYWDLRNHIVRPWDTVQITRYFWYRWIPIIGPSYTLIIVNFRLLCADQPQEEGDSNRLVVPHAKLAELCGLSLPTIKRSLAPRTFRDPSTWFLPLFLRPYRRYLYDPNKRKKVRAPNGYQVAMDDPLLPEDEVALRGIYAEEEVRRLIKEGVVDLRKYAELKGSRPKYQFDTQVPPRPKYQFDTQVPPRPKYQSDTQVPPRPKYQFDTQVNPLKSLKTAEGQDQIDTQVDQIDTQVQPPEIIEEIFQHSNTRINLIPHSSSSSSSDLKETTTTTTSPPDHPTDEPDTPKELIESVIKRFQGYISRKTAEQLIERHGFDTVRDQLRWFDYRDNTWADNGPAAAFATYCKSRTAPPPAYEEMVAEENRRRQEEAEWRAAPVEEQLGLLLASWEERYRDLPGPKGESVEPLPEEIEDLAAVLLPRLLEGRGRGELFGDLERKLEEVGRARERAIEQYELDLERALGAYRDGLLEVEQKALAEETRQRALARGGDFVKRYMPKVLLEAIEREIVLERVRETFPSWPEYWRSFRKTGG